MTRTGWMGVGLCVVLAGACRTHSSSYSRPGDDPRDTDSLYVLYRRVITDSNPVAVWQQFFCAYSRLAGRLGDEEAERRLRALRDTVYSPSERWKWNDVSGRLANHDYGLTDEACGAGFDSHYVPDTTVTGARPRDDRSR